MYFSMSYEQNIVDTFRISNIFFSLFSSIMEWRESAVIISFEDLAKPVFKLKVNKFN